MDFSKVLICFIVILSFSAPGLATEDQPDPGEAFTHFFTRITKGGRFPGIKLNATEKFQSAFLKRIFRGRWVGDRDKVYKKLADQNVNMWGEWYTSDKVLDFILPTEESRKTFFPYFSTSEENLPGCKDVCRSPEALRAVAWGQWKTAEIAAFTDAYVLRAPFFGGKRLVDHLAAQYGGSADQALKDSDFYILGNSEFEKKVRELGWEGPVYFRGITAPDPKNPSRRIILMNDDLMRKMTPFDRPLLRILEYSGILTHEMSHVFQDQMARGMGIDLEANSWEGVMVLEGFAEFLAERALKQAGQSVHYPSALELFAVEQGVEVVFRPGNETQGNLFPYTVGLPFAAASFDMDRDNTQTLQKETYDAITGPETLDDFVGKL